MVASLAAGLVAWLCVADSVPAELRHGGSSWPAMQSVFGMQAVWVIAVIVTWAQVGDEGVG